MRTGRSEQVISLAHRGEQEEGHQFKSGPQEEKKQNTTRRKRSGSVYFPLFFFFALHSSPRVYQPHPVSRELAVTDGAPPGGTTVVHSNPVPRSYH